MSEIKKDEDQEEVPDVSGGYVDGPTSGCIVEPWPDGGDAIGPNYPQNPFGPSGPVTDPAQLQA